MHKHVSRFRMIIQTITKWFWTHCQKNDTLIKEYCFLTIIFNSVLYFITFCCFEKHHVLLFKLVLVKKILVVNKIEKHNPWLMKRSRFCSRPFSKVLLVTPTPVFDHYWCSRTLQLSPAEKIRCLRRLRSCISYTASDVSNDLHHCNQHGHFLAYVARDVSYFCSQSSRIIHGINQSCGSHASVSNEGYADTRYKKNWEHFKMLGWGCKRTSDDIASLTGCFWTLVQLLQCSKYKKLIQLMSQYSCLVLRLARSIFLKHVTIYPPSGLRQRLWRDNIPISCCFWAMVAANWLKEVRHRSCSGREVQLTTSWAPSIKRNIYVCTYEIYILSRFLSIIQFFF